MALTTYGSLMCMFFFTSSDPLIESSENKSDLQNFQMVSRFDASFGPVELNLDGMYTTDSNKLKFYYRFTSFLEVVLGTMSSTGISSTIFRPDCTLNKSIVTAVYHDVLCDNEKYILPTPNYSHLIQMPVAKNQYLILTFGSRMRNHGSNCLEGILRMCGEFYGFGSWEFNTTLTLFSGQAYKYNKIIEASGRTPQYDFIPRNIIDTSSKLFYEWITYDIEKYDLDYFGTEIKFYNTFNSTWKYSDNFPNHTGISWHNAELNCRQRKMSLITLHSLEENLALPYIISRFPHETRLNQTRQPFLIYIGIKRKVSSKIGTILIWLLILDARD